LGALPLGTAPDGDTYSPAVSCERTIMAAIPISTNAQPTRFILLIALLFHLLESSQAAFFLSLPSSLSFRFVKNRFDWLRHLS
jgi:hypothetical protein